MKALKVFLLSLCLVLGACGGGGGGSAGAGAGSGNGGSTTSKTVAGILYKAEEATNHGYLSAQYAYTDGTVGTATTVVASYCSGNNDHDLIANTTVNPGTTYLYLICRNSGTIMGWAAGSSPSTTLTQVADVSPGVCCLAQQALSSNGKYLFVANKSTNTLLEYSVGNNGALTSMGTVLSFGGSYGVYSVAVSPSGNYLVLARADSAGTTYYLDEYAVDNSTGGLSQVGTDVTISTLNTFGGLYPAQNTNNGDLLSYVTGQGGNQLLVIKSGSSWGSSNIVALSLNGSASYGGPQFDTTGKVLYLSGLNTGACSGTEVLEVLAYSVGTGGASITQTASGCGVGSATSGNPVALDNTDGLYFTDESVWSVSATKVSYVGLAASGAFGTVFIP